MGLSERLQAHNLRLIALMLAIAAATGIAAGVQPRYGVAAALGLTFAAAVIADVTVGLFLFTILSFLEVFNAGSGAVSFIKLAGLILFVSWFAAQATRSRGASRSLLQSSPVLAWAVIGFVGWSAMSAAWAVSSGTALSSTSRFLLDVLLFPIVFGAIRRREQFVWIVGAFVLGAVISALIGLLQSGGARLAGGIGDYDGEAALLTTAMVLDVGLVATLRRDSPLRSLAILGGLIMGVGLVDTGSRGGFVALGVVLVAAVLFGGRWRPRAVALLLATVVLVPFYLFLLAPSAAVQHLSSDSSTGRTDLWKVGLKMWEANPVFGVGSGNFTQAAPHYVQQVGTITRADLIVDVPHVAHDTYLEIIDELGVPGFVLFVTIAVASISSALRAAKLYERAGDRHFELLSRAVALGLIAQLTADIFITNDYEHLLWLLLALPPALLAVARSDTRTVAH
ncbi:MAG TPA: O-antigen ligase family protein [Solirubrobacteraceae bacterium]|nr:O-antigen ligase family protein [Solirubrobacteraceae bacterium]